MTAGASPRSRRLWRHADERPSFSIIFFPWIMFILAAGRVQTSQEARQTLTGRLPQILEKTREYCNRLEKASLYFVCREAIDERQFNPPLRLFGLGGGGHGPHVTLEYDYQLIRREGRTEETRIGPAVIVAGDKGGTGLERHEPHGPHGERRRPASASQEIAGRQPAGEEQGKRHE